MIGVKTAKKLKVDFVDVEFGNAADTDNSKFLSFSLRLNWIGGTDFLRKVPAQESSAGFLSPESAQPHLHRSQSRAFLSEDGLPQPIEFFLASDAAAIIEHTKRVLYLEDDDIAHIANGGESGRTPL